MFDKINSQQTLMNSTLLQESVSMATAVRTLQFSESSLSQKAAESPGCCKRVWNALTSFLKAIMNFLCCRCCYKDKLQEAKKALRADIESLLHKRLDDLFTGNEKTYDKSVLIVTLRNPEKSKEASPLCVINPYGINFEGCMAQLEKELAPFYKAGVKVEMCLVGQDTTGANPHFHFYLYQDGKKECTLPSDHARVNSSLKEFCGERPMPWLQLRSGGYDLVHA